MSHTDLVRELMQKAKHATPDIPTIPGEKTRLLRAKLIYEEAMETIHALGCAVVDGVVRSVHNSIDLVEVVDGCCDVKVVTTGTLLAFGVDPERVQKIVDENNLQKFGPGHSYNEDGKLVKPPGFVGPQMLLHKDLFGEYNDGRTRIG